MNMKEFTSYIFNNYQKEIIEEKFDASNKRKNALKDKEKLETLKNETKRIFKVDGLITELGYGGMEFNYRDIPWVKIHDEKNIRTTHGEYIGISFEPTTKQIVLWLGFGRNEFKRKKAIISVKEKYNNILKSIEPTLKRGYEYYNINDKDAFLITKTINYNDIIDTEVIKDLEYLKDIYLKFEQKKNNSTPSIIPTPNVKVDLPKDKTIKGENIIYTGTPGSGKSYLVRETYLALKNTDGTPIYENGTLKLIDNLQYETVVFHPEYTNADFIGSIAPINNNTNVTYDFVPGPFTRMIKRSIENPQTNCYIIIEELNRGNAAAIFGDIFTLLDRVEKDNGTLGRSVYEISNPEMAKYIFNDSTKKIYIPENLSIIATMNTSDQNTTPLDSAFKRRWDIIWVSDKEKGEFDNLFIRGLNIKWGKFREIINNHIIKNNNAIYNHEDMQLGAYFLNKRYFSENYENNPEMLLKFINKVYLYLYEEICKYDKTIIFNSNIDCIDKLITTAKNSPFKVFSDQIIEELNEQNNN